MLTQGELRGCGVEEFEWGGVGNVKVVCCRDGVVAAVEGDRVGEEDSMVG